MKHYLWVVLVLVGCASVPPPVAFNRASSVRVSTNMGHGSGVVVSDKCIITADHVVEGAKQINTGMVMRVVKEDKDADLALLCAADSLGLPAVHLGATPQKDDPVYVVGDPLLWTSVVTEGRYENFNFITAPAAPGNSGGGVFNKAGELVGLVDALPTYPAYGGVVVFPTMTIIIGVDQIKSFLAGAI